MMVSAVWVSTSLATGTGWYGEPFQHTGGGLAPSVPQLTSRSEIFATGHVEDLRQALDDRRAVVVLLLRAPAGRR